MPGGSSKKGNQQASSAGKGKTSASKGKTSKHSLKPYEKPASISKHAKIIGSLGGRPRKEYNPYASIQR